MKQEEGRSLAIDIEGLQQDSQWQKVINGLMSSPGLLYRTKRGRLAIQVRPAALERLKKQLKFELTEGLDGTRKLAWTKDTQ